MAERYFLKFPDLKYANTNCKNITNRVVIERNLRKNPSLFHKYELKDGYRADLVAENYYDDGYYDWLIYLNNGIIDPYFDWYLDTNDFDNHITKKYGSFELANKKIKHYQLNWINDDQEISASFYDNNLPDNLKQYYTTVFGQNNKIISYKRKKEDVYTNTNKLYHFDITFNTGNSFIVGELVDIKTNSLANTIGGGEVIFANTTAIKVKNISGNTSANNKVVSQTTNTVASITNSDLLFENLDDSEFVYWTPVTYYEYELELNEKNKNIRLLDVSYAYEAAEKLRDSLKK